MVVAKGFIYLIERRTPNWKDAEVQHFDMLDYYQVIRILKRDV